MDGVGGGGTRGSGGGIRGRKIAPGKHGDSGTRGVHMQEPDSHNDARDNLGRRGSQRFCSKGKGKKHVEGEYRQTCGRYVITRGGKVGGAAGSHSRVASGDEMADMAGVIRNRITVHNIEDDVDVEEDEDEDDFDEDDGSHHDDVGENASGKDDVSEGSFEDASGKDDGDNRRIARIGRKFGSGHVHRSASQILDQKLDGDWITFKQIPHSVLKDMFKTFRTRWRWDPRDDQHIFEGFVNVLRDRYPDKMNNLREESKRKAQEDNHFIEDGKHGFDIICNYPPDKVPGDRWKRWCKMWNTEKWLNRSTAGKNNRKNDLSRHTGGSMGIDEHRICLEKRRGGPVGYDFVFVDTHATKETKKRLRDGEINITDLEQLEFVTTRSKESFTLFHKELEKEYGPDNDQNPDRDDLVVWERLHQKSCGRMFGIGSSDPHFVVTGSQSSFSRSITHDAAQRSQEVKEVRAQLEQETKARQNMENCLAQMAKDAEIERAKREKLERQMEIDLGKERAEREKERTEREKLQKQFEEIMKKFADK